MTDRTIQKTYNARKRFCEITHEKYRFERERLASFENWKNQEVKPEKLAEAGFFYTGTGDNTRCFSCMLLLNSWEKGENVRAVHQRWDYECAFLNGIVHGNVKIEEDTRPITPVISDKLELVTHVETLALDASKDKLSRKKSFIPKYPQMIDYAERLRSFLTWLKPRVSDAALADAGFFYTGRNEVTKCFHCGLALVDWESTDDPWLEHKMWNSECKYIMGTKGYTLRDIAVKRARNEGKISFPRPPTPSLDSDESDAETEAPVPEEARSTDETEEVLTQITYIAPPSSPVWSHKSGTNDSIESLEEVKSYQTNCQKCTVKPVDCTTLPCSHSLQCFDCLTDKDTCDYCYTPFKYIIRCIPK